jgi:hypothetical protein
MCGSCHTQEIGKIFKDWLHYRQVAHVGNKFVYPARSVTFDPGIPIPNFGKTVLQHLEDHEYEIIGSDEPERFSSGSFS